MTTFADEMNAIETEWHPKLKALLHKHGMGGQIDQGGWSIFHPTLPGRVRFHEWDSSKLRYENVCIFLRKAGVEP